MNIKKILIPLMALLIAVPGLANEKMKYKNPTGKEFPILAWYSVLGDSNQTKERYQELREAGFNISFPHFGTAAELEKGLAACKGKTFQCLRGVKGYALLHFRMTFIILGFPSVSFLISVSTKPLRRSTCAVSSGNLRFISTISLPPGTRDAAAWRAIAS